ncbi:MAG: hypothetical protein NZ480_05320 [Bdellovibrionaceae bacterium]|nr:hypothetical protein [Pseudobdellovibrionaceae bacterium]MDW8190393.1 hypothetical protein [Pseudobdellovibrionaceae bacterium]
MKSLSLLIFQVWLLLCYLCSFLLLAPQVMAYLSILDSGEPTSNKEMTVGFAPQFIVSDSGGSHGTFLFKTGVGSGQDLMIQAGFGHIDFWLTLATRWIPIPDYENQPAVGVRFDGTLAREASSSIGHMRLAPFLSKRFLSEVGQLEPYLYIPFGLTIHEGKYDNIASLVVGSQIQVEDLLPLYFYVETGFDVRNSFTYVSIGILSTFQKN